MLCNFMTAMSRLVNLNVSLSYWKDGRDRIKHGTTCPKLARDQSQNLARKLLVHVAAMLPLLRNLPSSSRPCFNAAGARRLASTAASSKELFKKYLSWKEDIGVQYKDARPRNWLGDERVCFLLPGSQSHNGLTTIFLQPFPLNTTFKPPAPISDELKDIIYATYMQNPVEYGVRQLAALYGLSIKRVDAILRLKGLEQHWKKVCLLFLTSCSVRCVLYDESKSISL